MREGRSHLIGESQIVEDVERLSSMWARCENLPTLSKRELVRQIVMLAWNGFIRSPITSMLTLITIGFSLFLFSAFLFVVTNSKSVVSSATQKLSVSIYIKDGVDDAAVSKLHDELSRFAGVASVKKLSKSDALIAFKTMVGEDSPMVLGLEEKNPLPQSLEVSLSEQSIGEDTYLRIVNDFSMNPHVESVRFNQGAFSHVGAMMRAVRTGGWIGTLIMLGITGLIISNAIRLAVYAHRNEIEIMQLVGATESYIRAPFLVEGAVQGFVGATVGVALLSFLYVPLQSFYNGSPFAVLLGGDLVFLAWWQVVAVLIIGTGIGLGASYLAARTFSEDL